MSPQPQMLRELGEELDRAARRTLSRRRSVRSILGRAGGGLALTVGGAMAVLVAVVAILVIRPQSHAPASARQHAHGRRGEIIDRDGRVLTRSVAVRFLEVRAVAARGTAVAVELRRLAKALGLPGPPGSFTRAAARGAVVYRRLVTPSTARFDARLTREFPGVRIVREYQRRYPMNDLAGQVLGIAPATGCGSGLECSYGSYLRSGDTLKLSLDANLQRVGQEALQHAIAANPPANGGAFVALNPGDGQVYAMGSLPTFDPNVLISKSLSKARYDQLFGASANYPQLNRAIQGAYPPGSTFKAITATAALQSRAWGVGETYDDTGVYVNGPGDVRHNAGHAAYGILDLVDAIKVSSDDFFYNLGALMNSERPPGALEAWARAYGIGQPTGIDLGGELAGELPTPARRAAANRLEAQCEQARHVRSCGIADGRPWLVGDNENLAVGQGDVHVTPLQLAVAYAAIANGGTIIRPHLATEIRAPDGHQIQRVDPPAVRHLDIDPRNLKIILQGLRAAASQPGGTSADVFGDFPINVYGTTGSTVGQQDYAWYAGFVPASATSRPIVVTVVVQQGGFGARAAAPVARQILSQWFFGNPGQWRQGSSRTL